MSSASSSSPLALSVTSRFRVIGQVVGAEAQAAALRELAERGTCFEARQPQPPPPPPPGTEARRARYCRTFAPGEITKGEWMKLTKCAQCGEGMPPGGVEGRGICDLCCDAAARNLMARGDEDAVLLLADHCLASRDFSLRVWRLGVVPRMETLLAEPVEDEKREMRAAATLVIREITRALAAAPQ